MSFVLAHWKLIGVVVLVVVLGIATKKFYNEAYQNGYNTATLEAQEFTKAAIKELANEADKAATDFLACTDSGKVWDFARNVCTDG